MSYFVTCSKDEEDEEHIKYDDVKSRTITSEKGEVISRTSSEDLHIYDLVYRIERDLS